MVPILEFVRHQRQPFGMQARRFSVFAWFGLVAVCLGQNLFAQDGAGSTSPVSIPFDQLGAAAGKQYSGDGLAVVSRSDGALLRCVFQRLSAQATAEGLWITSTVDEARGQPFRVIARTLGRSTREHLPPRGKVEAGEQVARFIRPGLTEEYSVSVDGLRQDFVLERRPEGMGLVRLALEVDGATAEAAADGVHLVLADGGRKMAYDRLKAKDARGKELAARLEVVSSNSLTVVLDDATAQYPVRIDPTFSDANWISLGGIPGANGHVDAAVVDGAGNLYIGGQFTIAGNALATNIAQWNGSSWLALGSGMNNSVEALAVSGTNLYAGGQFTTAGGVPANYIAQWNGASWSALGSGMDYIVWALLVSGTNLYAGGSFTNAGGVSANYIAQWDGSTWSALGSGMNSYVFALAVSGNHLFAGGEFTTAGNTGSACVAEAILGGGSGNTPPVIITTNSGLGFSNGLSQFGFDVSGAAGQTLVIQASTNLSDWMPLQTNLLDSALWYFSDTSAGNFPRRFYRVQLLP